MPETDRPDPVSALQALAKIANDNLAERLRHEAAAQILLAARRVSALMAPLGGEHLVDRLARGWDPRAVTALEYAEAMPVPTLDGLLFTAPRWARSMRAMLAPQPGAAAA